MLHAEGIYKSYNGEACLRGAELHLAAGEFVSLMGESGSGKTTLLEILTGVRPPDEGRVTVAGVDLASLTPSELAVFRRTKIGAVYQNFGLIPTLTAEENILLPMYLRREAGEATSARVKDIAAQLGIEGCLGRRPSELSGGQQQRVAIARAVIYSPPLLLLDEPTGSLDSENTERVLRFLEEYREKTGGTVFQITHSIVAAEGTRVVRIKDGVILT